jgi:hypothetical protein
MQSADGVAQEHSFESLMQRMSMVLDQRMMESKFIV